MRLEKKSVTLKGIIVPVDWDEKGNITTLALSTHYEEEYLIHNPSKRKELSGFIREVVKVTGLVEEVAGKKIIKIKSIEKSPKKQMNSRFF